MQVETSDTSEHGNYRLRRGFYGRANPSGRHKTPTRTEFVRNAHARTGSDSRLSANSSPAARKDRKGERERQKCPDRAQRRRMCTTKGAAVIEGNSVAALSCWKPSAGSAGRPASASGRRLRGRGRRRTAPAAATSAAGARRPRRLLPPAQVPPMMRASSSTPSRVPTATTESPASRRNSGPGEVCGPVRRSTATM